MGRINATIQVVPCKTEKRNFSLTDETGIEVCVCMYRRMFCVCSSRKIHTCTGKSEINFQEFSHQDYLMQAGCKRRFINTNNLNGYF